MKKKILLIMMLFITLNGSYKEEVKAASSLVFMETLSSTETPKPPFFQVPPPEKLTIEEDGVTTITTLITGTTPIKVYIRHNNVSIIDNSDYTITINQNIVTIVISETKAKHAGEYKIIATNKVSSVSAICTLTVAKKSPIQG